MSPKSRYLIFVLYSAIAVVAPLLALIFPGEPPIRINEQIINLSSEQLPEAQKILDSGAENYQQNVLHDMEGHLASVAADYPDGSSVLFARFSSLFNAEKAEHKLKKMIPHTQDEEKDLWSLHFTSDSGEYVMFSRLDTFLVLIIADRSDLARQRLEQLPAFVYNPHPGVGAMLAKFELAKLLMLFMLYVFLQALIIAYLKRSVTLARQLEASTQAAPTSGDGEQPKKGDVE